MDQQYHGLEATFIARSSATMLCLTGSIGVPRAQILINIKGDVKDSTKQLIAYAFEVS
jgi:hypothetical protein